MSVASIEPMRSDLRRAEGPLTADHRRELELARRRSKSIRRAAHVAAFNGWTTAVAAALSAPFALLGLSGLVMTLGIAVVAFHEFRGRKRLLNFDPSAATLLGCNQLGLLGLIVAYCLWALSANLNGASPLATEMQANADLETALGASLEDMAALGRQIVVLFYGLVIALSVVFQGLNALYYFSRRRYIDEFVAETPEWVRELQRATLPA